MNLRQHGWFQYLKETKLEDAENSQEVDKMENTIPELMYIKPHSPTLST
jgi:hypothetical protein